MPGVTIGENSIIGAYSLVKESIPPSVLAYGVPAKVIRMLSEEELKTMLKEIE
jgi:acetyltransferase-like isoleucine patch superfamily enzyme